MNNMSGIDRYRPPLALRPNGPQIPQPSPAGWVNGAHNSGGPSARDKTTDGIGIAYAGIAPRWGAEITGMAYPGRWPGPRNRAPLALRPNGPQVPQPSPAGWVDGAENSGGPSARDKTTDGIGIAYAGIAPRWGAGPLRRRTQAAGLG